jgi:hypothetical protein
MVYYRMTILSEKGDELDIKLQSDEVYANWNLPMSTPDNGKYLIDCANSTSNLPLYVFHPNVLSKVLIWLDKHVINHCIMIQNDKELKKGKFIRVEEILPN